MTDFTFWSIFAALVTGLLLLLYGPSRSELWQAVENWGSDNRRAALKRERRRAQRSSMVDQRERS